MLWSKRIMLGGKRVVLGSKRAMLSVKDIMLWHNGVMLLSKRVMLSVKGVALWSKRVVLWSKVDMLQGKRVILWGNEGRAMEQGGHAVGKGGFQDPGTQWGSLMAWSKPSWCDLALHGWMRRLGHAGICPCIEPSQQPG